MVFLERKMMEVSWVMCSAVQCYGAIVLKTAAGDEEVCVEQN